MRFSTDDGLFGFIVTPTARLGMYRFQLVVGGKLVGGTEPCYLVSAMEGLGRLISVSDARVAGASANPARVLAVIEADDALHDAALIQVAESLDGWQVRAYRYGDDVVWLAKRYTPDAETPILVSMVPAAVYQTLFAVCRGYWMSTQEHAA